MPDREPIQCAECGWTGQPADLDDPDDRCPLCANDIEFVE